VVAPEIYAVIDIGSNTMRLSVYRVEGERLQVMFHKKEMASLASYVEDDGCMSKAGVAQAIEVLGSFAETCRYLGVEHVFPFATASLRNIRNTRQVVRRIEDETGYAVDVLTGHQEAEYDFKGAMSAVDLSEGLLVDIGGGSTELVFFKKREACEAVSLPIGSLNLYKREVSGLIPDAAESQAICAATSHELDTVSCPKGMLDTSVICGVGGSIRATTRLYNVHYEKPNSNRSFDYEGLCALLDIFTQDTKHNRERILRIIPERSHTIVPGMLALKTVAERYGCQTVLTSARGVREGYLFTVLKKAAAENRV
jgi:exopolyphosphatase / guanosine-5'-triphosphate,3'-diphosphate pyrophosphatase